MMKTPSFPVKGVAVSDTVMEIINYLRAITVTSFVGGKVVQTSGGTTLAANGWSSPEVDSYKRHVPLLPIVDTDDGENYYCTVTDGTVVDYVNESGSEDSILYVDIDNLLTGGVPTKFSFASGQAIFVQLELDPDWSVKSATLIVDDAGETSLNPDGETGGLLYHKLAEFTLGGGDPPEVLYYGAGDNVHNQRPSSVGLTGYVTLYRWRDIDDLAVRYVRLVNGAVRELSSGAASDGSPSAEWGSQLIAFSWLDKGTSAATEDWNTA